MPKKLTLLVLVCFLLASCGWDDSTTPSQESWLLKVFGSGFEVFVPAAWREVTKEELNSPASGTFEMAYRSEIPRQGFYNNLVVISEDWIQDMSSLQFVDGVVVRDARQYSSFASIEKDLIRLADEQDTIVHTFRARYNAITWEYIYLQSGMVCDGKGYILTIGLHTDTSQEDISRYKSIIQSLTCTSALEEANN